MPGKIREHVFIQAEYSEGHKERLNSLLDELFDKEGKRNKSKF
jgi:hypothetical protein